MVYGLAPIILFASGRRAWMPAMTLFWRF